MLKENLIKRINVAFIGNTFVGKTNLIKKATGLEFTEHYLSTIGLEQVYKRINVEQKEYNLVFWDTSGQERFRAITKTIYRKCKIIIFIYDITNKESFEELQSVWLPEAQNILGNDFIIGIIANKSDLYQEEKITKEQGEEYANEINAKFLSFSAKTGSTYELDNFLEDLLKDYIKVNGLDEDEEENEGIIRLKREPKYEVIYRTVTVWEKCCLCCYCPRRLKFRLYRRPDGTTTCCRPH